MNKIKAFTLAEILITLTVIGIVAAIAIPSLISNVNERAWNTQRKALHVRLTNAVLDMPRIKGYGVYETAKNEETGKTEVTKDTASESFLVEGLSKVYKIKNICNKDNIEKCGISNTIVTFSGEKIDFPKTFQGIRGCRTGSGCEDTSLSPGIAAFQTPNGESVAVYYNKGCAPISQGVTEAHFPSLMCLNFIYDLNGLKAPNQIGKDMGFITAIYKEDLDVVAPNLYSSWASSGNVKYNDAKSICPKGTRMPTFQEAGSLAMNKPFIYKETNYGNFYNQAHTSDIITAGDTGKHWVAEFLGSGWGSNIRQYGNTASVAVYCIKE